jgi:hypothetical protein
VRYKRGLDLTIFLENDVLEIARAKCRLALADLAACGLLTLSLAWTAGPQLDNTERGLLLVITMLAAAGSMTVKGVLDTLTAMLDRDVDILMPDGSIVHLTAEDIARASGVEDADQ